MGRPSRRRGRRAPAMDFVAMVPAVGHSPLGEHAPERLSRDEQMPPRHPPPAMILPADRRFPFGWMTMPSAERTQASSPDHPGAERTGSGTRVRQSVLYSDRPRRSRRTRPTDSLLSDTELVVPMEAPSASGSAGFHPDHPGAERAVSGPRIRQSVLYSNRPRRPRRRQVPLPTEEHPSEVSSSELVGAATELPTLEALSLMNELPLFIPVETSEDSDDDNVCFDRHEEYHSEACSTHENLFSIDETMSANDTQAPLEESDYEYYEPPGVDAYGRTVVFFNQPKGISRAMVLAADALVITVSDDEEQPKPDSESDVDSNESESETEESARPPCVTMRELFDRICAREHAELTARAIERGIETPDAFFARVDAEEQRQQETRSLQAPQQDSAEAIERHEASTEDIVRRGKKWMCEEVMLCFKKCIERRPDLEGLEYKLDELCHQCFNVDSYNKVFHHYNFKVRMKMPSSVNWTVELYFAEVKQIFGRKYYFCCALEQDEDGDCYACKNQRVEDLKHPATGGYMGSPDDAQCSLW